MNRNRTSVVLLAVAMSLPAAALGQSDAGWTMAQTDPSQMGPQTPGMQGGQTGVQSPGPARTPSPDDSSMRSTLGAPGETGQQMRDEEFLRRATNGGVGQIELGKLAAQKGGPEVKELGQRLADDHTAIDKNLSGVADSLGVMLPKKVDKQDQAELKKLNSLSGDAFDKEYIAYVLRDHRQDMHAFRIEAMSAADDNLRTEAAKAMVVVHQHLQALTKLANEKGVPVPARPPHPNVQSAAK